MVDVVSEEVDVRGSLERERDVRGVVVVERVDVVVDIVVEFGWVDVCWRECGARVCACRRC